MSSNIRALSSKIRGQMSVFRSQAAKVFQREAFKHAVWVGVFGPLSKGKGGKTSTVNIVIFYDPHCSEREVWEWYDRSEKDRFGTDPDELRLERVLGRKVDIVRIFKGIARDERDIEAILHAQTIYGNFKHPVLQGLRSSWYQKVEEYKKKINGCEALANTAKEPGCSKASQCAYQITKILEANNHSPLYALVQSAQGIAGRLAKKSGIAPQESEELWIEVSDALLGLEYMLNDAKFAETVRNAK